MVSGSDLLRRWPKPVGFARNPLVRRDAPYGEAERRILSHAGAKVALDAIRRCPHYAPTPLLELGGLAQALGLGAIWYKDEGARFRLGSFKALGGAYAVARTLMRLVEAATGRPADIADLVDGRHREFTRNVTVACATDGNHGRSVAAGARLFGCRSVVFLHEGVSLAREQAIAAFGAEIVRTRGDYDASVVAADETARRNGWQIISDTSYPGYDLVPRDVMQGYTILVEEAVEQLGHGQGMAAFPATHIFLQGGVGGFAAAVAAHLWEGLGSRRPTVAVVEPERADCLLESARAGRPVRSAKDLDTVMAGLACGEPSLIAWEILATAADGFLSIPDEAAVAAMRLLADAPFGDRPVVAGESGAAGLAGLIAAVGDGDCRRALDLGPGSRVLLVGTEGATDPELYERLVGRSAAAVAAEAAGRRAA
jgi:diaminopropionate ammonia-lyase